METWIYLIEDKRTGLIKIGKSIDPERRIRELTAQSTLLPYSHDFDLIEAWWDDARRERELHRLFADRRVRGEWFSLDYDAQDQIADLFFNCVRFSDGLTAAEARQQDFDAYDEYMQEVEEQWIHHCQWEAKKQAELNG